MNNTNPHIVNDLRARHHDDYVAPTNEELRDLHRAYADFINAEPWNQIDDGHITVHHKPGFPDTYTTVFGRQGLARGFSIYIGETGFYNLSALLRGGTLQLLGMDLPNDSAYDFEEAELIYGLSCDRDDLTDQERQALRDAGIRYRGRGNWVQIRRATPGYIPYATDGAETRYATNVLRDMLEVARLIKSGDLDPENWVNFAHFLHATAEPDGWSHRWGGTRPFSYPDELHVDLSTLEDRLMSEAEWLVGDLQVGGVKDAKISVRPFNAKPQLAMDTANGLVIALKMPKGATTMLARQEAFADTLTNAPALPRRVIAHDAPTLVAIGTICDELDITVAISNHRVPQFENAIPFWALHS